MEHPVQINLKDLFSDLIEIETLPDGFKHDIHWATKEGWKNDDFTAFMHDHDAPDAYFCHLEFITSIPLRIPFKVLRPDLFWLFNNNDEECIEVKETLGKKSNLSLMEKKYILVYSSVNDYELLFAPGHHSIFFFAYKAERLLRYSEKSSFRRFEKLTLPLRSAATVCLSSHQLDMDSSFTKCFQMIKDLSFSDSLSSELHIYKILAILIDTSHIDIIEKRQTIQKESPKVLIDRVRMTIEDQVKQGRVKKLSEITGLYGRTTEHLSLIHKEHYAINLQDFYRITRLEHGKLMVEEGFGNDHIAEHLGYQEISSFVRAYTSFHGNPPGGDRPQDDDDF